MVPHPDALIWQSRDAPSAPIPAVDQRTERRSAARDDLSGQDVLKEAQKLLTQVLGMLSDPICEKQASSAWSFRLARGHLLTLLDHLAQMEESHKAPRK